MWYLTRFILCMSLFLSFILSAQQQSVVLISLDGFRWDYIEQYDAKGLQKIAQQGVQVNKMWPVYPSKTFPNHISIITGLRPVNHGIIDNKFCDKNRNECYKMGSGKDDSTWFNGIPLWNLARMQGLKSATYFWPESDARFNGMVPNYYYHYSQQSDYQARIDQIIQWLSLEEGVRPHFVAGYFSLVDSIGHDFGPNSTQVYDAVQQVDKLITDLQLRLSQLAHPVNLVIVSDHGMTEVDVSQQIDLAHLSIPKEWVVKNTGPRALIYAKQASAKDVQNIKKLLTIESKGRFSILDKHTLMKRHYVGSPRIPDIILETSPPKVFSEHNNVTYKGTHGYVDTDDMAAIFIAQGPAFKSGMKISEMENLEVYPIIAEILGLKLMNKIDSNGDVLRKAVK
ncbi:alkaline phosphatase family protein [Pseudoalteromonas sp. MMG013]|uniref:alkaline phosphatase family protein n=1 Tax=Pseudoalteromonas sp. MMG013 TaxID=2822687 RepID=UPI001B359718|nr:ectonucleotide pyrophosphatase/phosphodiesterase [Pseudoalteromonas sp. MMG013]MBQ4860661.1 alkaline phosphatase family protein [Pseudoalteromonas sp. MMG013]